MNWEAPRPPGWDEDDTNDVRKESPRPRLPVAAAEHLLNTFFTGIVVVLLIATGCLLMLHWAGVL